MAAGEEEEEESLWTQKHQKFVGGRSGLGSLLTYLCSALPGHLSQPHLPWSPGHPGGKDPTVGGRRGRKRRGKMKEGERRQWTKRERRGERGG